MPRLTNPQDSKLDSTSESDLESVQFSIKAPQSHAESSGPSQSPTQVSVKSSADSTEVKPKDSYQIYRNETALTLSIQFNHLLEDLIKQLQMFLGEEEARSQGEIGNLENKLRLNRHLLSLDSSQASTSTFKQHYKKYPKFITLNKLVEEYDMNAVDADISATSSESALRTSSELLELRPVQIQQHLHEMPPNASFMPTMRRRVRLLRFAEVEAQPNHLDTRLLLSAKAIILILIILISFGTYLISKHVSESKTPEATLQDS